MRMRLISELAVLAVLAVLAILAILAIFRPSLNFLVGLWGQGGQVAILKCGGFDE